MSTPILLGFDHDRAVGEALVEQLLAAARLTDDAAVADLISDGVLARAVQRRLGPRGRLAILPPGAVGDRIPLADESLDALLCLLTLGFGEWRALLDEARRAIRPSGTVLVLSYDREKPPEVEAPLLDALSSHEQDSPYFNALLPADLIAVATQRGYIRSQVRDIARFDSPDHYWRTMVEGRPLGVEFDAMDAAQAASIRAAVLEELRCHRAADDTLRIPVTAVLLHG